MICALFFDSALACFSARFSLIDFPAFLARCCRGDLSAMAAPREEPAWLLPCTVRLSTVTGRSSGAEPVDRGPVWEVAPVRGRGAHHVETSAEASPHRPRP